MHPRMTAERAIRTLIDMDRQVVCPRPSMFGEIACLVAELAIEHASLLTDENELLLGDLSFLLDDPLPRDAKRVWKLGD